MPPTSAPYDEVAKYGKFLKGDFSTAFIMASDQRHCCVPTSRIFFQKQKFSRREVERKFCDKPTETSMTAPRSRRCSRRIRGCISRRKTPARSLPVFETLSETSDTSDDSQDMLRRISAERPREDILRLILSGKFLGANACPCFDRDVR